MYSTDTDAFRELLSKLAVLFGKDLTPELTTLYWEALKDQPIGVVERQGAYHMRYGKFFPKPVELRPKDERAKGAPDPVGEARFKEAEARAVANLEELRKENPEAWKREVASRHLARTLAITHPSSPVYAEALRELQQKISAASRAS